MTDLILLAILAVICGGAARYIYKAKKRGAKCVGCPSSQTCGTCSGGSSCNGSCHSDS